MIADDDQDTARTSGFDPRYDPAFQRGYQPQPGERAHTRVRAVTPAPAETPQRTRALPDDRPDPATGSEAAGTAWEATVEPALDLSAPSFPVVPSGLAAASGPTVSGPGLLAGVELSPRRNPYMLALWIVGAALVVLGVVVYAIAANTSYTNNYSGTGSDVATQVFIQIGWVLAGPMITIGFATLVGLLFLTALGGRRRSVADPGGFVEGDEEL